MSDSEDSSGDDLPRYVDNEEGGDWLKTDLLDYFETFPTAKAFQFATQSHEPDLPNPELSINDVGPIILPLRAEQASAITDVAHRAPYGKGADTLIDTSVRKTWQLNPTDFQLTSPDWEDWIKSKLIDIKRNMGICVPFHAELYKLLLYEEGSFFKPHKDSEKAPGMLGTLVISLPSKHEGGDVVLHHAGKTTTYASSDSPSTLSFAAWYADVTHEIEPITSGYRFVLTYNLVADPGSTPRYASDLPCEGNKLFNIFEAWSTASDDLPGKLVYMLDHEYTEANLCFNALKGPDMSLVRQLVQVAKNCDFELLLGHVEHSRGGAADEEWPIYDPFEECSEEEIDDEDEDDDDNEDEDPGEPPAEDSTLACHPIHEDMDITEKFYLARVVDLDGNSIIKELVIDKEEIVQIDRWKSRAPDEEDYEVTGNEGATAVHWYYDTAVIIMPRENYKMFTLEPTLADESNHISLLRRLRTEYETNKDDRHADTLLRVCQEIVERRGGDGLWPTSESDSYDSYLRPNHVSWSADEIMGLVIRSFLDLKLWLNLAGCVRKRRNRLPVEIYETIGSVVDPENGEVLSEILGMALAREEDVVDYFNALNSIDKGIKIAAQQGDVQWYPTWMRRKIRKKTVSSPDFLGGKIGTFLGSLATTNGTEFLWNIVNDFSTETWSRTSFIVHFLTAVYAHNQDKDEATPLPLSTDVKKEVYKLSLQKLLASFDLTLFLPMKPKSLTSNSYLYSHSFGYPRNSGSDVGPKHTEERDSIRSLAYFYEYCWALTLHQEADRILGCVAHQVTSDGASSATFVEEVLMPLLKALIPILKEQKRPLDEEVLHTLWISIFESLRKDYLGPEPTTGDFVCPTVGCGCKDCQSLDRFLQNPNARHETFAMGKRRRDHLECRLGRSSHKQDTDYGTKPNRLLITKGPSPSQHKRTTWVQRRTSACNFVKSFAFGDLKTLLGQECDRLTSYPLSSHQYPPISQNAQSSTSAGNDVAGRSSLSDRPASQQNMRAASKSGPGPMKNPQKRKAVDVIDLTENKRR